MYFRPDGKAKRTARDVRSNFSHVCSTDHATIILNNGHPVAILTPIDTRAVYHVGPKSKHIAACRRSFLAALEQLRTQ